MTDEERRRFAELTERLLRDERLSGDDHTEYWALASKWGSAVALALVEGREP